MNSTTHAQNKERIEVNAQLLETPLMQADALLKEMVKIWITLGPSQKEALLQEATRALSLNQAIDRLRGTKMGQ
jgi:hypothetical protein